MKGILRLRALAAAAAASGGYDHELMIYGDIGQSFFGDSVEAAKVVEQLEAAKPKKLLVRINSHGGSVDDGHAIHNAIRAIVDAGGTVVTRIEGTAASISSLIAMAGTRVEMYANAILMIHGPHAQFAGGNSGDLREAAAALDVYAAAMATSYARKTGRSEGEELAVLSDRKDHWLTAAQAVEQKYADAVIDAAEESDTEARAMPRTAPVLASFSRYRSAPIAIAASFSSSVLGARSRSAKQPAARSAHPQEFDMNLKFLALALGLSVADDADDAAVRAQVLAALKLADDASDEDIQASLSKRSAASKSKAKAKATTPPAAGEEPTREDEIDGMCAIVLADGSLTPDQTKRIDRFKARAKLDAKKSIDDVRAELLKMLDTGADSIGGDYVPNVVMGTEARDKRVEAAAAWLVVRAGIQLPKDSEIGKTVAKAMEGNPFRGLNMADIAREVLEANGQSTRRMGRLEVVKAAITHSTNDFPNIFENALNKTLLIGAATVNPTWRRFSKIGNLVDFRPHIRYRAGSFSDLLAKGENGEFKSGTLPDAERETITGLTKGRILSISREMMINDDMSVFSDIVFRLGQAATRSVEKDVFALFALNSGFGPTMSDGNPLFHASHNNIVTPTGAPSVTTFEAARVAMAQQQDVGSNDYLDIRPAIWLGPTGLGGTARVTNDAQYDPDTANKLQKPNMVRGLYSDIVDTPRLSSTPWYSFADPMIEPVIEVAFLDGVQTPQIESEESFDTAGMRWRVMYDYAVGAVGYRGANRNAG